MVVVPFVNYFMVITRFYPPVYNVGSNLLDRIWTPLQNVINENNTIIFHSSDSIRQFTKFDSP